jgi:hypothetical protein
MIDGVFLLGDSVDFLEDAAVNILIISAIGRSAGRACRPPVDVSRIRRA